MKVHFLLKNTGMFERLGIMTLSSTLKQKGHEVKLTLTEELSEDEVIKTVKDFQPNVLAYSIMTGEHIYHIDPSTDYFQQFKSIPFTAIKCINRLHNHISCGGE